MRSVTLTPWHVIALLGALQAAILAIVLAAGRSNRTANRLLATALACFAIDLATVAYHAAGLVDVYPHLFGLGHPMPFLYGPLVYLYAVSASDRTRRLAWRDSIHLVPFLAVVVTGIPIYALSGADKAALYHAMQGGVVPWQVVVAGPLKLALGVAYSAATLMFLRRHHDLVAANYSSLERVSLGWLRWLAVSAGVIWLTATAFTLAEPLGIVPPVLGDTVITMMVTLLVYGIAYSGLRQPEIVRFDTMEHPVPPGAAPSVLKEAKIVSQETGPQETEQQETEQQEAGLEEALAPEAADETVQRDPLVMLPDTPASRYERSGLTERQAAALKKRLLDVMERDRPYRVAELTLADLAGKLGTTPHKLSETLNSQVGLSFYDFVNGYRVRDVQQRLLTEDAARLTFLTLAMDAGFASKSTFNAVFKKHTGQTPSDYRVAAEGDPARRSA